MPLLKESFNLSLLVKQCVSSNGYCDLWATVWLSSQGRSYLLLNSDQRTSPVFRNVVISVLIFLWWMSYIFAMLLILKKNEERKSKKHDAVGEVKIMRVEFYFSFYRKGFESLQDGHV